MKKKTKKKAQVLTIDNFLTIVPWHELERKFGKREYKKFLKWMTGQTCVEEGVYTWDLKNYLGGGAVWD